jgi:hypothetical protein
MHVFDELYLFLIRALINIYTGVSKQKCALIHYAVSNIKINLQTQTAKTGRT